MQTKVIHDSIPASSGSSKKQDTTNTIFNSTLNSLLSLQGMSSIIDTFASNTLSSLTTKHMLASARKSEAISQ